jgi:hypothetical protein
MKPSAIYSKTGKGVQEASGKTSLLKRTDRAVLSAIDGRATLGEVAQKVGKGFDGAFELLIAQLDKDGFVREVAAGASSSSSQSRPAVATVKPAAKASTSKGASGGGDDLDFTTVMPALKPAGRPAAAASSTPASKSNTQQESALIKARQEAEAKAQGERDKLRQEAEARARVDAEAKARVDAEKRLREEAAAKAKAEIEAQVRAAREKAEAEQRAKLEAERRIREEVERKAREEAERALRETEALRQRLEEERKAREEVERKRREEEERRRREEEEQRRAREEAERKRREEEERKRREEEERRLREEIEAKAREAAERARREEEDRLLREKEEQVRRAKEAEEARMRQARELEEARGRARQRERGEGEGKRGQAETRSRQPTLPAAQPSQADFPSGESLDALMADLDSFSQREEEERQAREGADRKAREEGTRRAQEDAERREREQAAAAEERERQRAAEEARRREEEERRALEEAERRLREEESRRQEADERERKAREAAAKAQELAAAAAAAAPAEDIGVTDKDLDMSEVRRDEAAVAREARKAQRDREREQRQRSKEAQERARAAAREQPGKVPKARRPVKWGRPVAMLFFISLAVAVGALHVVPLPMGEYERAASEALGRPVRIGVGRVSLFSGLRFNLENVVVDGSVKIASVHAYPELGSLMDEKRKAFRRIELAGVAVPQAAIGEVVNARMRGTTLKVGRILATDVKLSGPLPLPTFEADARVGPDGAVASVTLRGPEGLNARLTPGPKGEVEFDVTAASFTVPFAPEVSLETFAMKGIANRQGMNIASWGGSVLDGVVSGSATLRWSTQWQLEGSMTARHINAAFLAPALLSEGKAEGIGRFSMSGADPAKLHRAARIEGSFAVGKGALGTVDLSRVLQTSGRQYGGRTQFTELTGHGVYDRGAVSLRNVNISAGALSAGASADIAPGGALVGHLVADIRTTAQPLRATLTLGGTVKEPQIRN